MDKETLMAFLIMNPKRTRSGSILHWTGNHFRLPHGDLNFPLQRKSRKHLTKPTGMLD
jgi:hypothetical protein